MNLGKVFSTLGSARQLCVNLRNPTAPRLRRTGLREKIGSIVVCMAICTAGNAQLSPSRQAVNRMQKGKWKGAEESLRKAIRKDTLNPEARFLLSKFYFSNENPSRNIDSAYRYTLLAIRDYGASSVKEKERLKRFPLDSALLIDQRKKIDSAAFERAKLINSEKSYRDFLSTFVYASEQTAAIELRDEVAFVEALKINTYKVFLAYMNTYPASHRVPEAKQRYEKLLYEDKTREGKLKNFEAFYSAYPASPYRKEVEKNIFEIITASGKPSAWTRFISRYPLGTFRSRAEAILYHVSKDEDENAIAMVLTDSLKKVHLLEQGFWVSVLRHGKFGFIDHRGVEMLSPQFESISPEYLCGDIREDFLRVDDGIISRDRHWIMKGSLLDVSDVGSGFLKINSGTCIRLVHKSGLAFSDQCREDVKMIARNFIAFREHMKWGLTSLAGKLLLEPQYDDVMALDELIILVRNGRRIIVTIDEVAAVADKNPLAAARVFDDVQRIAPGNYLVRNGSLEGVLNASLEFAVALNRQQITKVQQGLMLNRDQKYFLTGASDKLAGREFVNVQFYGNWIRLQERDNLQLYDVKQKKVVRHQLDSLWFENELAFARSNDSLTVYLRSGTALNFAAGTEVSFVKSTGYSGYFFIPEKNKKVVFNSETGKKLFAFDFDEVEYMGEKIFLVSAGNKKGLLSEAGKVILPLEYAAIVSAGPGIVSLLKDKKFGMYQVKTKKLLKPVYDRNVIPISSNRLVAYREGAYGFIAWDAKPQGLFEFEEVRAWNDTSAMVKKNFQWMIYVIPTGKVVMDKIKDYRFVSNFPGEKVAIIHRDAYYGIISNKRGEIIPASFSELINVGSEEEPLYFAEKNVEEAEIYVVIYYDKNGKFLAKQVYEEEEYERIYCSEKNK